MIVVFYHRFSLLKSWLQASGYTVFLDVQELEAGQFGQNLLKSIQKSKNFILVLTEKALDKCLNDADLKDWVHRVSLRKRSLKKFDADKTQSYEYRKLSRQSNASVT